MEAISADLACRCIATARIGAALAVVASAGQARHNAAATLVGQRLPFAPPTGSVFAAWLPDKEVEQWLGRVADAERRQVSRTALELVRVRGYSLGLINEAQREFSARLDAIASGRAHAAGLDSLIEGLAYDPAHLTPAVYSAVRLVSTPVFAASGQVALALTLYDFPKPPTSNGVESYVTRLIDAAARITAKLGGRIT
jgi:DNA-binding IclR family transcriptional regulator